MGTGCVILGASGFTGGELLRLLQSHPSLIVEAVSGGRSAGRDLSEVHPHLPSGTPLLPLSDALTGAGPVCFSCLPHGEASAIDWSSFELVVDLSEDHRHVAGWTYGLPELSRGIEGATRIANPGCYPTAALLCLVPFARAGVIEGTVTVDALSGYSGAGREAADRLMFATADGGATAYGSIPHRHVVEIEKGLAAFGGLDAVVSFTPHLVPMARGVLITARCRLKREFSDAGARDLLKKTYEGRPFVRVTNDWPATKAVSGSNAAIVSARVDERAGVLVCSAAIDNLGKGAAGQALQNANLALGSDESIGLSTVGVWP